MTEAGEHKLGTDLYSGRLREKVVDIFANNPSPHEEQSILNWRREVLIADDPEGRELWRGLRVSLKDLESLDPSQTEGEEPHENLQKVTEAARVELQQLPPDFLEQILERFEPLIKNLPAGHGKAHFFRDAANLLGILRDPDLDRNKIDEVELLVGIIAGLFHDIGNSIVGRYEDPYRFAGHAEVGAALFAKVAKGTPETGRLIPENLTRLIQYSIAAHTHYPPTREVVLQDGSKEKPGAYPDETSGDLRRAVWLTRQSDRRDNQANLAHIVRDMIVRITPTQDFDPITKEFKNRLSPEENFPMFFGLSPENINNSLIGHVIVYANNVFRENDYTSHDSDYFTHQLMEPGVGDLLLLLQVMVPEKLEDVLGEIIRNDPEAAARLRNELRNYEHSTTEFANRTISSDDVYTAVDKFKQICRVIEPAPDLEDRLAKFDTYFFEQLSSEDQAKWARGILFMKEVLLNRWYSRLVQGVTGSLELGSKITSQNPAVKRQFDEIGNQLQAIAQQSVDEMNFTSRAT